MKTTETARADLDRAIATYEAVRTDPDRIEDALAETHTVTGSILAQPAASIEAVKLKARALAWEIEGATPETLIADQIALDALRGFLADVQRLR